MLKKTLLLFSLATMIFLSCSKQTPPVVAPDINREALEVKRLSACRDTNFEQGLLKFNNVQNLFICTKWDELFPELFSSIKKVGRDEWNHFFSPIDQQFLDNKKNRNILINSIKKMDREGGLDDFSEILTVLNKTNFYDSLVKLFECSEKPNRDDCRSRRREYLSKEEIVSVLKILDFTKEEIAISYELGQAVVPIILKLELEIKEEFNKFLKDSEFVKQRVNLSNSMAQKIRGGVDKIERNFLSNIFLAKEKAGKKSFMYLFFKDLVEDDFIEMVNDFTIKNPDMYKDIYALREISKNGLVCNSPIKMKMDVNPTLDLLFQVLQKGTVKDFIAEISKGILNVKAGETFCQDIVSYQVPEGSPYWVEGHKVNLNELIESSLRIYSQKQNYTLLKFFSYLMANVIKENPRELLRIFGHEMYFNSYRMVREINRLSPSFFPMNLKLLKELSENDYKKIGVLVQKVLNRADNKTFAAMGKLWLFWNFEEKNFLFKFMDKHFEKHMNYTALFDFYLSIMKELIKTGPEISRKWFADKINEDKTFNSVKSLAKNLSGKKVLADFKRFFSAKHIINIIKVISRGAHLKIEAEETLARINIDTMYQNMGAIPFRHKTDELTEREVQFVNCLTSISSKNLYDNVMSFPSNCKEFSGKDIAVKSMSWLNELNVDYAKVMGNQHYLLERDGLLAPEQIAQSVSLSHIINKQTTGGLRSVMDGLSELYTTKGKKYFSNLEKVLLSLVEIFSFSKEDGKEFRNRLLREASHEENTSRIEEYFLNTSLVLGDYSKSYQNLNDDYPHDPKFDCEAFNNLKNGGFPCPDKTILKTLLPKVLRDLRTQYQEDIPSAGSNLLWSVKADGGMEIPFARSERKKYPITLSETFKMVWELSDRNLKINKLLIPYKANHESDIQYVEHKERDYSIKDLVVDPEVNKKTELDDKVKFKKIPMTSLERIEVVIRDVKFDENYLGAHYKNSVAASTDYNKTVRKKRRLFKTCVNMKFCGKFMNKDQRRMGKNAIATFDSLLDANTYEDSEHKWRYGDYMKALLTTFVSSSNRDVQGDSMVTIKLFGMKIEVPKIQSKSKLLKHNGKLLTKISMLSSFSNLARILHIRFKNEQKLNEFIDSESFKIVEENLLRGFVRKQTDPVINSIIKKIETVKDEDGATLGDHLIDFFYDLNYKEARLVEDFFANTMLLTSFIGIPRSYQEGNEEIEKFKGQTLFKLLSYADELVDLWPYFKPLISNTKTLRILVAANNLFKFFNKGLMAEKNGPGPYYKVLNESFIFFQKVLDKGNDHVSGIELLKSMVEDNSQGPEKIIVIGDNLYDLIGYFHQKSGNSIKLLTLVSNFRKIIKDKNFDLTILKRYVGMTTSKIVCVDVDGLVCRPNNHYDEIFNVLKYSSTISNGNTKLNNFFRRVIFEEKDNLSSLFEDILPTIQLN